MAALKRQGTQQIMDEGKDTFRRSDWQAVGGRRTGFARITTLSGTHWWRTGLTSGLRSTAFSCRNTRNSASVAIRRHSNTAETDRGFRVT